MCKHVNQYRYFYNKLIQVSISSFYRRGQAVIEDGKLAI